jgi:pimeloyl-ACP methyl ester carboxylesterase
MTDAAISADGTRIAFETHGDRSPALVFVHGWSCDRGYWAGQLPLAERFRIVAIDLAGHGESGAGRAEWSIASFGADVAAVVAHLGLERVVLLGHSSGGDVIVEAARRLSGRVAGLVWVDAYKSLGPRRPAEAMEAFTAPFRASFRETTAAFVRSMFAPTSPPAVIERIAADMASAPPDVAIPSLVAAVTYGSEIPGALRELALPVFAINADYAPTDVGSLSRCGIDVAVMPSVGHFPMIEDPPRFNALLATVLDKLAR